jgi:hypothetical protein
MTMVAHFAIDGANHGFTRMAAGRARRGKAGAQGTLQRSWQFATCCKKVVP